MVAAFALALQCLGGAISRVLAAKASGSSGGVRPIVKAIASCSIAKRDAYIDVHLENEHRTW